MRTDPPAVTARAQADATTQPASPYPWERPLGATVRDDGSACFRVWAPSAGSLALRVGEHELAAVEVGLGVFECETHARGGEDYHWVVDGAQLPDPASRWQPDGLRGPSRVLDPSAFRWTDAGFRPVALAQQVICELHIGTFSAEGTFDGAIAHLRDLAQLGITAIELMPVAEFPGRHGWGYDGVYLSAAHSAYGGPEGLARLVDAAHAEGLAVILDVVYNHVGASGVKALEAFGPYFTDKYETAWGRAMNYDDAHCDGVREWVVQSAVGWIRDFHLDGLRLDAIHAIVDSSSEHIVAAVARRVHASSPDALVIAESGLNDPRVMRPRDQGGYGCDAAWADDFHHALVALLTGERDGYYEEFGHVAQLAKAFRRPHVHAGDYSTFRKRRFGAPAPDVAPKHFVVFSQNHDQVGNRAFGDRLAPEVQPLAAFTTLLAPFVPLLFMGEEYGERRPFQFFSDHIDEEIAIATREGRRREFAAFAQFADEELPDPQDTDTFAASKLSREADLSMRELYAALLRARGELPAGDADWIEHDEQQRRLTVRRGRHELVCNFAATPARVRCRGDTVVVSTHGASIEGGLLTLAPLSGALVV